MIEYIDKQSAIGMLSQRKHHAIKEYNYDEVRLMDFLIGGIEDLPSADVRENVHHEWEHLGGDEWLCPACGHVVATEGSWEHPLTRGCKFCENCGADMRGNQDDESKN